MNRNPEYEVIRGTEEWILIEDMAERYQCQSVTNGAEKVVEKLHRSGMGNRLLFYVDTMGQVDQLLHDGQGNFKGFKSGYHSLNEFWKDHE